MLDVCRDGYGRVAMACPGECPAPNFQLHTTISDSLNLFHLYPQFFLSLFIIFRDTLCQKKSSSPCFLAFLAPSTFNTRNLPHPDPFLNIGRDIPLPRCPCRLL